MKSILRVPTKEPYAYIEVEIEAPTVDDAIEQHREITRKVQGGFGLDQKEWNKALDRYMNEETMDADTHAQMDERQQWMIHELDKAGSRINHKNK